MTIPVFIQPVQGSGFLARSSFGHTAEAPTAAEALRLIRAETNRQFSEGATLTSIDLPDSERPFLKFAGDLKDEPYFDEWVKHMADYRKSIDNDPNTF